MTKEQIETLRAIITMLEEVLGDHRMKQGTQSDGSDLYLIETKNHE